MHTGPMKDSDGEFDSWKTAERKCVKCGGAVRYRIWESNCGGHEDCQYKCESCDHTWWVDGADS